MKKSSTRNILSILDLNPQEIKKLLQSAEHIKKKPKKYINAMRNKTLLMIFQAPSLRTKISFEVAMNQMGGNALNYDLQNSPLGAGKETIEDSSRVISRYADAVTARIYNHTELELFASVSEIAVINAMTNLEHPCQVLSDLFTIQEKFKKLHGLKLCYLGDCNNNVTNSLVLGCASLGIDVSLAHPKDNEFTINEEILITARSLGKQNKSYIEVYSNPKLAIKEADIVYTDSWMSYHIPASKHAARVKSLSTYQVNEKLMAMAKEKTVFMHCLPAKRGEEVTNEVLDGSQSIVLMQAENRMHLQKALLYGLIG